MARCIAVSEARMRREPTRVDRFESQIASVSVRETRSGHQEGGRAAVLGVASGLAWHGLADVPLQKLAAVQPAEFSVFGFEEAFVGMLAARSDPEPDQRVERSARCA